MKFPKLWTLSTIILASLNNKNRFLKPSEIWNRTKQIYQPPISQLFLRRTLKKVSKTQSDSAFNLTEFLPPHPKNRYFLPVTPETIYNASVPNPPNHRYQLLWTFLNKSRRKLSNKCSKCFPLSMEITRFIRKWAVRPILSGFGRRNWIRDWF